MMHAGIPRHQVHIDELVVCKEQNPNEVFSSFFAKSKKNMILPLFVPRTTRPIHRCFVSTTLRYKPSESSVETATAESLLINEDNGVLTLTLNRPRQRNALDKKLLQAFKSELDRASVSPKDIRAVVIQSVKGCPVFSSGHDLKEMMAVDSSEQADLYALCGTITGLLPALPQPTIAAVDGLATAAGLQLVAACDLVVANPTSTFSTPGAKSIGLFCHTPAVSLVRSVGLKQALDMVFTGRPVSAQEALQFGLVTQLAEDPQKDAAELAQLIASKSAAAVQAGKRTLYSQASARSLKTAYEIATDAMIGNLQTSDAKSGIGAFLRKEPQPIWKHE